MKRRDESVNDALLDYIDPEHIEKAPAGFTSRVMENIRLQQVAVKRKPLLSRIVTIPRISVIVVTVLVIAAALMPDSQTTILPFTDALKGISLPSVSFDFDFISGIAVPAWLPYLFLAVLFLMLLDKALWGLFHRQK